VVARVGVEVARVGGGFDVGGGVCVLRCERGVDLDLDFLGVEASMAILDLHIGRRKRERVEYKRWKGFWYCVLV
jgi:hypothetical protein